MSDKKPIYIRLEERLADGYDAADDPKIEPLLLDVAALEAAAAELVANASIFAMLTSVLDAMNESGEFTQPITDHSSLFGLNFGGGSVMLHVGDFRKLRESARKVEACLAPQD